MTSTSLFVLCISGCIHPTEPIDYPKPEYAAFAVDLQNGFQGDTVVVKVDNQILYERATTTNLSNGFAFRLVPAISAGTHQIEVSIPSLAVQTDTTLLIVPDVLVVGINFDRSKSQLSLSVDTTWLNDRSQFGKRRTARRLLRPLYASPRLRGPSHPVRRTKRNFSRTLRASRMPG